MRRTVMASPRKVMKKITASVYPIFSRSPNPLPRKVSSGAITFSVVSYWYTSLVHVCELTFSQVLGFSLLVSIDD